MINLIKEALKCAELEMINNSPKTKTLEEKLEYRKNNFNTYAYKAVNKTFKKNGYSKLTDFDETKLNEYKNTNVYEMYINEDFDRLVKYYSLGFVKK